MQLHFGCSLYRVLGVVDILGGVRVKLIKKVLKQSKVNRLLFYRITSCFVDQRLSVTTIVCFVFPDKVIIEILIKV